MPPATTARSRLKVELDQVSSSPPSLKGINEGSHVPVTSVANIVVDPQSSQGLTSTSKDRDSQNECPEISYIRRFLEEMAPQKNIGAEATAAGSKNVSSSEAEANNPYSSQYPLSRQVYDLEKRAQELQDKNELFREQCYELTLTLERLTKATRKERSDHEAKCKSLEAAKDAMAKQLEEEKEKVKELQAKNESLVADLAAATEEKTMLSRMLEEKTYESWIFRCAITVVFKVTPSVRERVTMRKLLVDVLNCLREKHQQERAAQEGHGAQDQSNSTHVTEQTTESYKQQEESQMVHNSGESDLDSEDLPLSERKSLQKGQKRPRMTNGNGDRASNDDSDEDKPLFLVLKKKAKKLKIMSSREKSSSSD